METKNIIIICITFLLFVGIITFGIVINELSENPYEQCLKSCNYADKITCTRICNEDFKEVIMDLTTKIIPLIKDLEECNLK